MLTVHGFRVHRKPAWRASSQYGRWVCVQKGNSYAIKLDRTQIFALAQT